MVKIEGHECTLFFDYDFYRSSIIKKLSDDGKITWLELRMRMIFLEPISSLFDRNSLVFKELETPKNNFPRTGTLLSVSVLMNGLEALGSFLTTKNSTKRKNFFTFIKRYMANWNIKIESPRNSNKQINLIEILWKDYRNGLAHSFAIGSAGVDIVQGTDKYKIAGDLLQIDIWKFFTDFQTAVNQMFDEVRKNHKLRKIFLSRFKFVYKC